MFTDECTAFVRGLDAKVTEAELKQLLAPCGEVKDVRLVKDRFTGHHKVCINLQLACTWSFGCPKHKLKAV